MSVFRCGYCTRHVQWMLTKFKDTASGQYQRRLFEFPPVPVTDVPIVDGEEVVGWIPGRWRIGRHERPAMAPLSHYGRDKRDRIRHVVLLHVCKALPESA